MASIFMVVDASWKAHFALLGRRHQVGLGEEINAKTPRRQGAKICGFVFQSTLRLRVSATLR
jgi:hypothetical protein